MVKLSIVIPVYNKAGFLERCLDSLLPIPDCVEVLLIDDESTDESVKIEEQYASKHRQIRLYKIPHSGVSRARNLGIVKAKGQALAFLDADDNLEPDALGCMVAFADRGYSIIQYGQNRHHKDGRVVRKERPKGQFKLPNTPTYWNMIWNKVFKTSFIRKNRLRFREDLGFGEDELFMVDALFEAGSLWHAPQVLVNHYLDDMNSICRGGLCVEWLDKLDDELEAIYHRENGIKKEWLEKVIKRHRSSKTFKEYSFSLKGKGKHDAVYLLKESQRNEELKYSLRSVDANFKVNKVWFSGGHPIGLKPDGRVRVVQDQSSKWENVRKQLIACCKNDDITEDFWLMNDDFFILKPTDDTQPSLYNGTLAAQISRCEYREGGQTDYTRRLRHLVKTLEGAGLPTLNYSIHKPMLVNRKKALEVLEKFPDEPMFRALYGNYWDVRGVNKPDNKIRRNDMAIKPGWQFVSSQDSSFRNGEVGRELRAMFDRPSRFENG